MRQHELEIGPIGVLYQEDPRFGGRVLVKPATQVDVGERGAGKWRRSLRSILPSGDLPGRLQARLDLSLARLQLPGAAPLGAKLLGLRPIAGRILRGLRTIKDRAERVRAIAMCSWRR